MRCDDEEELVLHLLYTMITTALHRLAFSVVFRKISGHRRLL